MQWSALIQLLSKIQSSYYGLIIIDGHNYAFITFFYYMRLPHELWHAPTVNKLLYALNDDKCWRCTRVFLRTRPGLHFLILEFGSGLLKQINSKIGCWWNWVSTIFGDLFKKHQWCYKQRVSLKWQQPAKQFPCWQIRLRRSWTRYDNDKYKRLDCLREAKRGSFQTIIMPT